MASCTRPAMGRELYTVRKGWETENEWTKDWTPESSASYEKNRGLHPPAWNSSVCLARWKVPHQQTEIDPKGYLVLTKAREQLGNNKLLVSDGLYIAKALGRTLVEYPVAKARISGPDSVLGLGAYWDLDRLCKYHRMLDLEAFRLLINRRFLSPDNFTTLRAGPREKGMIKIHRFGRVREAFRDFEDSPVIVLELAWKSKKIRKATHLVRPNPYYRLVARQLVAQQAGWTKGRFIAVQWRTERMEGDLEECYDHVHQTVEKYRFAHGMSKDQVFFNVDLLKGTSETYEANGMPNTSTHVLASIQRHYPMGMDNTIYQQLENVKDSGVKAFVTGFVVAHSTVLLTSSFGTINVVPNKHCQKEHSHYVDMIMEWRADMVRGDPPIPLFPSA